jgi:hypothetical protein
MLKEIAITTVVVLVVIFALKKIKLGGETVLK